MLNPVFLYSSERRTTQKLLSEDVESRFKNIHKRVQREGVWRGALERGILGMIRTGLLLTANNDS